MANTLRVHSLAKELGVPSKAVIEKCRAEGIELIAFGPPAPHRDIGLAWRRASSRALEFGELGATLKEIFGACSPRW